MEAENIEIIHPESEQHWLKLRTQDITSTEVPALFGLSPYMTEFELWHRKKETIHVEFQENERTQWGKRLEQAIALGVAEEQGLTVRPMKEYIRQPKLRAGSSFDYSIEKHSMPDYKEELGILEIKNVDGLQFKNGWIIDENDNLEAPPHIELQVQHQMLVSGRKFAYVAALVGGNTLKLTRREADQEIQFKMVDAIHRFWKSQDANIPPEPDFKRDAEFIAKIYGYAEPGKILDASSHPEVISLCGQYSAVSKQAKEYDDAKKGIKAQLLSLIGDAEKVIGPGFSVSAGMIGPTTIPSYERKGYRDFRVYTKKEK